ncbi:hypothetical protein ES707_18746 [subsurface metagenome]
MDVEQQINVLWDEIIAIRLRLKKIEGKEIQDPRDSS